MIFFCSLNLILQHCFRSFAVCLLSNHLFTPKLHNLSSHLLLTVLPQGDTLISMEAIPQIQQHQPPTLWRDLVGCPCQCLCQVCCNNTTISHQINRTGSTIVIANMVVLMQAQRYLLNSIYFIQPEGRQGVKASNQLF